jgi:hypothetical protein
MDKGLLQFATIFYLGTAWVFFIAQMWTKVLGYVEYSYGKLFIYSIVWPYFILFG